MQQQGADKKMWYVYEVNATQPSKEGTGSLVETWMDLGDCRITEAREKNKYHIPTYICGI